MSASNYYDSALLGYQARVNPDYNKAELRELETEVLTVGLQNQNYLMDTPNYTKIKNSVNRPVYGYVLNRKASTNGTAMTAFNTGIGGTSAQTTLTWVAFTEEFYFNETTGMDNVYSKYELFDNEMSQAQRNIRERVRKWLISNIYAGRTGYDKGGIKGATFNSATSTWEVSGTNAQEPWATMSSVMRQNKYGYSKYDIFADSVMYPNFYQYQMAQTANNATNLAYQFDKKSIPPGNGGYLNNIWEDIIMGTTDCPYTGDYTNGYALVLPEKSFAFVPWMPEIYQVGGGDYQSYRGGYGTVKDMTVPGLEYMVHGWATQADTTSGSGHGYTQDSVTQWQVGTYLCYLTTYLSQANETPIYGFGMKP